MAKSRDWDVWLVAADQVYKGVPADVVAGWAAQGRLAPTDKLRPAGSDAAWGAAKDAPGVGGFFAPNRPSPLADAPTADLELGPAPRRREAEDDEVDMIPLIDVSLVLLVFFMLTTVVATTPSVDVPAIKNVTTFSPEANALVIQIEQPTPGALTYAVRPVESVAAPEDANLKTLPELLQRLDAMLAARPTAPAVRIACQGSVPSERFLAVASELEARQRAKRIEAYTADVQERQ